MEHLVNNPVFPDPDPVQRFRASEFLHVMGEGIIGEAFKMFEKYEGVMFRESSGDPSQRCS